MENLARLNSIHDKRTRSSGGLRLPHLRLLRFIAGRDDAAGGD